MATIRRAEGLLHLVQRNFPQAVRSSGEFDDWAVVGPALIAQIGDLTEGILSAPPPRGRLRAEILARSLCEYVITFAWLAATNDEDERRRRLRLFVKDEFERREGAENLLADQFRKRSLYARVVAEKEIPETLLDDVTRRRLAELKSEAGQDRRPGAFDAAVEADAYWMPRIPLIGRSPLALLYFLMFTGLSFTTHASITAVTKIVSGDPPDLTIG